MYAKVIVGVDGSERAEHAVAAGSMAARCFDRPLELLTVDQPAASDGDGRVDARVVVHDDAVAALVAEAKATTPPGLLCLSSRGRGALGELVFGSVTAGVIRTLHAPLVVTGPRFFPTTARWARVLVCLDGSVTAASILPVVRSWATQLDLAVDLLHVAYPMGSYLEEPSAEEPSRLVGAELERTAEDLRAVGVTCRSMVVEHTDVPVAIAEQAAYRMADLIALATHGRTGLARVIAGNVTLETLRRATVPVLTMRPETLT